MTSAGWSVQGRTALITGAARGIGAESARHLARRGANVALVGLEPERLEALAARLGDRAAAFEADVTDLEALERAAAGTVERFGAIDVAIANAGLHFVGALTTAPLAQIERELDVNLHGVLRTLRAGDVGARAIHQAQRDDERQQRSHAQRTHEWQFRRMSRSPWLDIRPADVG